MSNRRSINGARARHQNPIPNASRVGNIVMSSVISGANPGTRDLPPDLAGQMANLFRHMRDDIAAAGGSVDDIVKVTFWMQDLTTGRAAINDEWVRMFPDEASRPARHTLASSGPSAGPSCGGNALVTCEFVAVLGT
jgi:2-iminobutanoate/2-iminopropanoate deaminase